MKRWLIFLFITFVARLYSADLDISLHEIINLQDGRYDSDLTTKTRILNSLSSGKTLLSVPDQLLLFGKGSSSAVSRYGGILQTSAGGYFTAIVSSSALKALQGETAIEYLSYGPEVQKLMDKAAPYIYAGQPSNAGYTGNEVVVGIVDTGIDIAHPDFTTENGLSRIISIWDQTVDNKSFRPDGFSYGKEYTKWQIDKGECKEIDTDGHGTHVSGIAAGSGRQSKGLYRGIAPGANIVMVKADRSSMSYIVDGIHYILAKAKSIGKPCVINISLGTHSGSHSETDGINQAIDALVESYGKKGIAIVWAAGNDGENPVHTVNTISSSTNTAVSMNYGGSQFLQADFWFPAGNFDIAVVDPLSNTNISFTNTSNFNVIVNSDVTVSSGNYSGERKISLWIKSSLSGLWQIVFGTNTSPVVIDGYIANYSYQFSANFFYNAVYTGTLDSSACQKDSITVAAVITKTNFINIYNNDLSYDYFYSSLGPQNIYDRALFSSIGPARDGKHKPDITAPGGFVTSTFSKDMISYDSSTKVNDYYFTLAGTSMAAPIVTGMIAQMFEKEPYLTVDDIRNKLIATARTSGNITPVGPGNWDKSYGYGVASFSGFTNNDAGQASLDVTIKNNIINVSQGKDNQLIISFRSNSSQIGKKASVKIFDRNGNLMNEYGPDTVQGIEVKNYVWDGRDRFGRTVQAGLYFAFISVDNTFNRYPVLVVR
jgi:minor extracellular serine protease Vpr